MEEESWDVAIITRNIYKNVMMLFTLRAYLGLLPLRSKQNDVGHDLKSLRPVLDSWSLRRHH